MLQKIQEELAHQKLEFKQLEQNITQKINDNINEKFEKINLKTEELEEKLKKQDIRLEFFEKQLKKKNLIFFGLEEVSEKSYHDLEAKMIEFIKNKMKIPCEKSEIESIRRMGKKGENPRPIAVTFSTLGKKLQVLYKKKTLDNSSYYLKEDYSKNVLEKRKNLQEELKKLKGEGKRAMLKQDKIVIITKTNVEKGNRNNSKRNLSESPKTNQNSADNLYTKQVNKKNKPDITGYLIRNQKDEE